MTLGAAFTWTSKTATAGDAGPLPEGTEPPLLEGTEPDAYRGAVAYAPLDLKVWCGARSLMQASKPRGGTKSGSRLPVTLGYKVKEPAAGDGRTPHTVPARSKLWEACCR